jgi:hypothetical protein
MDLFAPNKDVNDYGARNSKNVSYCQLIYTIYYINACRVCSSIPQFSLLRLKLESLVTTHTSLMV